jgi:hypothetical protein
MARSLIRVAADFLLLAARLQTSGTVRVLALPSPMAGLAAEVRTALEFLPANVTTPNISQPAGLVLQSFLTTHTTLLAQEGALRARIVVLVAIVGHLWMAASFGTLARVPARRRHRPAGEWRLKNGTAAVAVDLFENGFPARSARALVAKLLADVVAALERSSTLAGANMLCFDTIINMTMRRGEWTLLPLGRLALDRLALTRTAALFTRMSSAVEVSAAHSPTLRLFLMTLMANGRRSGSPTAAVDADMLQAGRAIPRMADLWTEMPT